MVVKKVSVGARLHEAASLEQILDTGLSRRT